MANSLFNDNRLKLGVFGINVSNGCAATTAEGHLEPTWQNNVAIAAMADRAGIEALVPVAQWKGFGGKTNFNGTCFESYTWAAGLAACTRQAAVFSTSHVPRMHPIVAAKQATTIDHISNGRFVLNVVCGWYEPEFLMFASPIMEHDTLYDYAAEWLEIIRRLWTSEDEFDFEGRFFHINKGFEHEIPDREVVFPVVWPTGSGIVSRHVVPPISHVMG